MRSRWAIRGRIPALPRRSARPTASVAPHDRRYGRWQAVAGPFPPSVIAGKAAVEETARRRPILFPAYRGSHLLQRRCRVPLKKVPPIPQSDTPAAPRLLGRNPDREGRGHAPTDDRLRGPSRRLSARPPRGERERRTSSGPPNEPRGHRLGYAATSARGGPQHHPHRLVADAEVSGQRPQTLGPGAGADGRFFGRRERPGTRGIAATPAAAMPARQSAQVGHGYATCGEQR